MNLTDQEEYMKLHNHFQDDQDEKSFGVTYLGHGKMKSIKLLAFIRRIGNKFENGLSIKTSRLNHSCMPNAVNSEFNDVWAVCNIKAGQEVTICYKEDGLFGLKTT
jgi:hypothetical protein